MFPEAPPQPALPPGFVGCPVPLTPGQVAVVQHVYQLAYQLAVEASRPTQYERFCYRSVN